MRKLSIITLALVLTLAMAGMSFGSTATGTLNVSATVVPTCSISTAPVTFGNYDGVTFLYSNGDITVTCASGTPYHISLDAGQHSNGWRSISNGVDRLYYGLYKNMSEGGVEWGDADYANTYPDGASLADTGNDAAQAHTLYGALWLSGSVSPGTYTDVVQVTVYY
jgi:spore coat protein U-like protein